MNSAQLELVRASLRTEAHRQTTLGQQASERAARLEAAGNAPMAEALRCVAEQHICASTFFRQQVQELK